MNATKISVWQEDDTGLWIVSADDDDGGTETLVVRNCDAAARDCGRERAARLGLPLVACDRYGVETRID